VRACDREDLNLLDARTLTMATDQGIERETGALPLVENMEINFPRGCAVRNRGLGREGGQRKNGSSFRDISIYSIII
jgi:hypothetical protein